MAHHSARRLSAAGSAQGSRDNSKSGSGQVQQQIFLALRQLREDMQSVMERLDVVESLATANVRKLNKLSQNCTCYLSKDCREYRTIDYLIY